MKKYYLILVIVMAFLAACGPAERDSTTDDEPDTSELVTDEGETVDVVEPDAPVVEAPVDTSPLAGETELSDELLDILPEFDESDIQETESGLRYVILEPGSGDEPTAGDFVVTNYTGYLVDGTKFDSSIDRAETFDFPLGQGRVIQGWDQGFTLLKPGGRALLIIPPQLGYGPAGASPQIPPDATLVFEVELVDVRVARKPVEIAAGDYTEFDSGVRYYDFEVGSGASPQNGEVAIIEFAIWDASTNEMLSSSEDVGRPVGLPIGEEAVITGLDEGIQTMAVGGSRQLVIPAALAQAPSDLIFELTLVDISAGSPESPTEIDADAFIELPSGVQYATIAEGEGDVVAEGAPLEVHYTAWTEAGEKIDSTIDRALPQPIILGQANVPGWNEGLVDIRVGEVRQLFVPADIVGDLGFEEPTGLIFEVEIFEPEG